MVHEPTCDPARRIAVRAQLLDADRPADVVEVAEQLGYVKIDPTSVTTTAEHTMLWARIGWSYEPGHLQKAVELDRQLFEFDGAFRPVSLLPSMRPAMRRAPRATETRDWLEANRAFRDAVLARLASSTTTRPNGCWIFAPAGGGHREAALRVDPDAPAGLDDDPGGAGRRDPGARRVARRTRHGYR